MTNEEAISLIEKLRRDQPNNRELWRLLDDHELRIYSKPAKPDVIWDTGPRQLHGPTSAVFPSAKVKITCPVCEKRKKAKAASMKRWRKKNPEPSDDRYLGSTKDKTS